MPATAARDVALDVTLDVTLADLMLSLCAAAGPMQTIDPQEVARAFAASTDQGERPWLTYLQSVRNTAVALARDGKIIIYHKGRQADPESFRGTYRLGCPNFG
jgi:hypothetical protein